MASNRTKSASPIALNPLSDFFECMPSSCLISIATILLLLVDRIPDVGEVMRASFVAFSPSLSNVLFYGGYWYLPTL
jgi:hypothetical protein